MTPTHAPIDMVCAHCGSTDVVCDAQVTWDKQRQEWVLSNVLDYGDCNKCGAEKCIVERTIGETE